VISNNTTTSTVSNSITKRIVSVGLYSTISGELIGFSTTTATKVNGKNTLSCVEKDLDGNIINEYTIENASNLAVDLIGSWEQTSCSYTDDEVAFRNESFVCDKQFYEEALITAKTVIERVFEDGKLKGTISANYTPSGNTININDVAKQIVINSDIMTVTYKDCSQKEGWSGTLVTKYSRK